MLELYTQGETLKLVKLKSSLPDAARDLITGAMHTREQGSMDDSRQKVLGKGGRSNGSNAQAHAVEDPAGQVYDKVQALAAKVWTAKRCLTAGGADAKIFASCFTVDTRPAKIGKWQKFFNITRTKKGNICLFAQISGYILDIHDFVEI